jgi:hypothetical protein
LPPNSIIDLREVVTPKPAMANTKNHCETSARKPERIIGIKPLLFTIKHKAKPRANQGKALGLMVLYFRLNRFLRMLYFPYVHQDTFHKDN